MDYFLQDSMLFFESHSELWPLYCEFSEKLLARFPETQVSVRKTQISFHNPRLYACVSFLRVKKAGARPYFTLTLGLPAPLESPRAVAQVEPHPGRWTVHIALSGPNELDGELFGWLEQAYTFARVKRAKNI